MSMMMSFCAVFFFPRGVLDEILNLIESVSEGFPSLFCKVGHKNLCFYIMFLPLIYLRFISPEVQQATVLHESKP